MGRAPALVALGCMLAVTGVEGQVCCQAVTAQCEACQKGVSVEEYCKNNPMVTGCPSEMCADSPAQQCRMLCADPPACAADQCVMRKGTCCDMECVAKDPAPAPSEMCPDSPPQYCRALCPAPPACAADQCVMREGNCCDMKCVAKKDPDTPTVCCEALTAECLSCKEDTSFDEYCEENPHTTGCEGACCSEKIKKGKPAGLNCMACFKGETKAEFCEHLLGETTSAAWWQDIDSWLSAKKNREKKLRRKCKKYNDKHAREQLDITVSAGGESATAVRVRAHDNNAPVKCEMSKLSMGSVATNVILAVVIVILAVVVCRGRQDRISAEVEREPTGSSPSSSPTAKMQPSPVV